MKNKSQTSFRKHFSIHHWTNTHTFITEYSIVFSESFFSKADKDIITILLMNSIDNTNSTKAYGLIGVHKKDFPECVIVSTVGSPTYFSHKAISRLIHKYLPKPQPTPGNSTGLIDCLKSLSYYTIIALFLLTGYLFPQIYTQVQSFRIWKTNAETQKITLLTALLS